jgi:hypothetical protein
MFALWKKEGERETCGAAHGLGGVQSLGHTVDKRTDMLDFELDTLDVILFDNQFIGK